MNFLIFVFMTYFLIEKSCMGCGPVKVRRFILWSPPPISLFEFKVDGAARGKPGPAGIGGVL